ncbi:uncharacterized protein PHALS_13560 [Plasmopara halstedii]|uniref:Uncharacterized protein n=1 Tax=Plasmopara halstedii TaxID=4781 RepID=A0A0P1APY4_PLAHL|nr:uncharacterized protein PHALS_13560 [Plasmopara halstedii]CEG43360.1 hypothetical protein PHALS_13560 [Plasmopara halstedii]|eukprot:XP_024579729.1 hypothetical protein PHALS_13560 [Plasmopara halstedii]
MTYVGLFCCTTTGVLFCCGLPSNALELAGHFFSCSTLNTLFMNRMDSGNSNRYTSVMNGDVLRVEQYLLSNLEALVASLAIVVSFLLLLSCLE